MSPTYIECYQGYQGNFLVGSTGSSVVLLVISDTRSTKLQSSRNLTLAVQFWTPTRSLSSTNLNMYRNSLVKSRRKTGPHDHCTTYASLNLHPLRLLRHAQKLKMTYKIINNHSCIPKSTFQLHPHPSPRNANSCQLYAPFASTNAYKYSFFINVVSYWNSDLFLRTSLTLPPQIPLKPAYFDTFFLLNFFLFTVVFFFNHSSPKCTYYVLTLLFL